MVALFCERMFRCPVGRLPRNAGCCESAEGQIDGPAVSRRSLCHDVCLFLHHSMVLIEY